MSILIKTITNLPEHCYECPCRNYESGYCQADKEHKYSVDRPFWCPLVEINNELEQVPYDDCISRQDLLNRLDDFNKWCKDGRLQGSLFAIDVIKDMPSVTPQPKIGYWINDRCSECGKGIDDLIDSREWYENELPNFCPFCGIPIRK